MIALGEPQRKVVRRNDQGDEETWIYFRTEYDQIPRWTREYYRDKNGAVVSVPRYDPVEVRRTEPDFEVTLINGKVKAWTRL